MKCIKSVFNNQFILIASKHLFYLEFYILIMEKLCWKQVRQNERVGSVPHLRWGHSCCTIDDEVIVFGGYADSNYMNDVWSFNTISMEWSFIETTGQIPSPRSNCSMNYDKVNNRIILFGGGGPNKSRFNSINILDWRTKQWTEVNPKSNEPAPWERTYHTAELYYPHLVVFGGEGVGDLQDLWVFNCETIDWTQLTPSNSIKPCARRFHTSARIGNQFFVIAGCYSKYRCLNDIFSIDLTAFFKTGKSESLSWRQLKVSNCSFLTRWGHTSVVYDGKIYVFGGRFSNDLNDILVIDPNQVQMKMLKVAGSSPKGRRRHCACFLGNSMLIFGGFNGEYFNDLHYISIKSAQPRLTVQNNFNIESIQRLKAMKVMQYEAVFTKKGEKYQICVGLLINKISNLQNFDDFLKDINYCYTNQELTSMMLSIYRGYGIIDTQLVEKYGICMFQTKQQSDQEYKKQFTSSLRQIITTNKRLRQVQPLILLDNQAYSSYLQFKRTEQCYYDITFNINDQAYFRVNKAVIAMNSSYFLNLMSGHFQQSPDIIKINVNNIPVFETFLYYLSTNFVIASKNQNYQFWLELLELAEYYCASQLMKICENQLLSYVFDQSCQQLLIAGLEMDLRQLSLACAQNMINNMVNQNKQENLDIFPTLKSEHLNLKREKILKQVYNILRFDILQKKIQSQEKEVKNSTKTMEGDNSDWRQDQKQNNQIQN